MSKKALLLLKQIFGEQSNLQLPVGVFEQVKEIREWIDKKLEDKEEKDIA